MDEENEEEVQNDINRFLLKEQRIMESPVSSKSQNNLQNAVRLILSDDNDYSVLYDGLNIFRQIIISLGTRRICESLDETLIQRLIEIMLYSPSPDIQMLSVHCISLLSTTEYFPVHMFLNETVIAFLYHLSFETLLNEEQSHIPIRILNRVSTNFDVCEYIIEQGFLNLINSFGENIQYGIIFLNLINSGLIKGFDQDLIEISIKMINNNSINFQYGVHSLISMHEKCHLSDDILNNLIKKLCNESYDNTKMYETIKILAIIDNPSVDVIKNIVNSIVLMKEDCVISLISIFVDKCELLFEIYENNLYKIILEMASTQSYATKKYIFEVLPIFLSKQFYEDQSIIDIIGIYLDVEETENGALELFYNVAQKYLELNRFKQFIDFSRPYLPIIESLQDSESKKTQLNVNKLIDLINETI